MDPFNFDAGTVNPSEISPEYVFQNTNITNYLHNVTSKKLLFLVGPKGCGKTLLIRYKAYLHHQNRLDEYAQGYQEQASEDLVESLEFSLGNLSRGDLGLLVPLNNWIRIWNFSLTYLILKRSGIGLPGRLAHIDQRFEDLNNLSVIVAEILSFPQEFLASNHILGHTNAMIGRLDHLQHSFVLFVDRLDQALNVFLTSDTFQNIYRGSNDRKISPFDIWRHAQYGLLQAAYSLTTARNRHVKIFATARAEALKVKSDTVQNVSGYCLKLKYTPDELKIIFEKNIKKVSTKNLKGTKRDSPWQRFFGFEMMEHLKARDHLGYPREEHVFDFLCRHSYQRAREVLRLGLEIYREVVVRRDNTRPIDTEYIENIRRIVNNAAYEDIMQDYAKEFIPSFKDEYLSLCTETFSSNLIPLEQIQADDVDQDMVNYLYRAGLLGYAKKGKQVFEDTAKYIYEDNQDYPIADYYLLHPTLDRRMQMRHHFDKFYNAGMIIGNGYPFHPPVGLMSNVESKYELGYYIPDKISGSGSGKNTQIIPTREELYNKLFKEPEDEVFSAQVNDRISDVFRMLTLTAKLYYTGKVETVYKTDHSNYRKELNASLARLAGRTDYSARIEKIDAKGMHQFLARVFGRMVTVGLLLYTDLEQVEIHHLLRNFHYAPNANKIATEGAVKSFRNCFFINGLTYGYPVHYHERETILEGLSSFERLHLQRWRSNFRNHDMMVDKEFNKDQLSFLERIME